MKRITCENDGCDQLRLANETVCETCGQRQTTRNRALVRLVFTYPIEVALLLFAVLIVGGLVAPVAMGRVGPKARRAPALSSTGLAMNEVRRFVRRSHRIRDSSESHVYDPD